jgi:hypothetical protein
MGRPSLLAALALLMPACSWIFGSSSSGSDAEKRYEANLAELKTVASHVDRKPLQEIQSKIASAQDAFAKIPKSGEERERQLDALNMRLAGDIEAARALSAEANAATIAAIKASLVGTWTGDGVTVKISPTYAFDYKRKSAVLRKDFSGAIVRLDVDQLEAGTNGINTKFEMVPPREVSGAWKMTLDGTELTRSP